MAEGSTVYSPTQYGPVGQETSPGTTAVDSQTQGSLAQLVLQPTDCTFSGDWWNGKLSEVWKGPWTTIKDLPAGAFKVGQKRDTAVASLGTSAVVRFSVPSPGSDQFGVKQDWVIESC